MLGLLAAYGFVMLVALMARLPPLERGIGADRLARWHAMGVPGDRTRIQPPVRVIAEGPYGAFTPSASNRRLLLIAGGVGITPS